MLSKKSLLLWLLSSVWVFACTHQAKNPFDGNQPDNRISVMAYNVENLFDTERDPGKDDFTFLPLKDKQKSDDVQSYCNKQKGGRAKECFTLDWNKKVLGQKIQKISKSILQVYGHGPDILMLEEVENLNVLKKLNQEGLKKAQYQTEVLIEGPDKRGIDVALLSRFPLAGDPKLHAIKWDAALDFDPEPTRGILEVPLLMPNKKIIHIFVLHLPSQGAPTPFRQDGVNTIVQLVKAVPSDRYWVVGGDWNITAEEEDKSKLVSETLSSIGRVSHLVGCKSCKGTHNYRKDWSFLDMLVFSPNLFDLDSKTKVITDSITIPRWGEDQAKASGRPKRFDPIEGSGAADHFPIYAEIEVNKPTKE